MHFVHLGWSRFLILLEHSFFVIQWVYQHGGSWLQHLPSLLPIYQIVKLLCPALFWSPYRSLIRFSSGLWLGFSKLYSSCGEAIVLLVWMFYFFIFSFPANVSSSLPTSKEEVRNWLLPRISRRIIYPPWDNSRTFVVNFCKASLVVVFGLLIVRPIVSCSALSLAPSSG